MVTIDTIIITTGIDKVPDGWMAFIFAMVIAGVGFMLSVKWKLKCEKLEKKLKRRR